MSEPHLLLDVDDGVAMVTLNRPDRMNAMTPEMVVRLAQVWERVTADPSVRVAVVAGAGDRAFSVGADLGRLIPLLTGARDPEDEWDEAMKADPRMLGRALMRTTEFHIPVIAAVRGFALAGGTELALACDLRVAGTDSQFGLTEVTRGIIPAMGSLARLPRQIPYARAAEIVLIGDRIPAEEAMAMGLLNRIVPPDDVLPTAMGLARRIAENGPLALRKAKEAMVRSSGRPLEDAFKVENECAKSVMASEDAREGPRAFMEKRKPNFTGR
jgi:enoyl-CoA hydratase/carnithine racemase